MPRRLAGRGHGQRRAGNDGLYSGRAGACGADAEEAVWGLRGQGEEISAALRAFLTVLHGKARHADGDSVWELAKLFE